MLMWHFSDNFNAYEPIAWYAAGVNLLRGLLRPLPNGVQSL